MTLPFESSLHLSFCCGYENRDPSWIYIIVVMIVKIGVIIPLEVRIVWCYDNVTLGSIITSCVLLLFQKSAPFLDSYCCYNDGKNRNDWCYHYWKWRVYTMAMQIFFVIKRFHDTNDNSMGWCCWYDSVFSLCSVAPLLNMSTLFSLLFFFVG